MPAEVVTSENLAEYNAARMPQAVDPPEAKKEEAKPAPKADAEDEGDDGEEEAPRPKARKPGIEGRFSELSQRAKAAEEREAAATRRAEAADAKARELEEKLSPKVKPDDGKPKASEYTDPFEFAADLSKWEVKDALAKRDKADADAKAKESTEKVQKAFQERIAKAKAEIPDFDEVLMASDLSVSDDVRDAIIESDLGPQILHYLAQNADQAEKINGMNTKQALREIGRLEVRLEPKAKEEKAEEEKPKVKKEPLPEPITPIKAKGSADNPLSSAGEFTGTYAEYKAARMRQK